MAAKLGQAIYWGCRVVAAMLGWIVGIAWRAASAMICRRRLKS